MKKGEKLEFLIKKKHPYKSKREFAKQADIPPTTLQGVLTRGFDTVSITNAKKIARALDMTVDELDDYLNSKAEHEVEQVDENKVNEKMQIYYNTLKSKTMRTLDFFGSVLAGVPQSLEGIQHAEKIELPKIMLGKHENANNTFAIRVNGESMNKIIPNGSLAICIPIESLDEIKNEDIVIFTKDNETSMKRFYSTNEAIIFSPESTMRCFYDVVIERDTIEDVKINAKVISYHTFLD